jgi:hypothetical protein
MHGGSIDAKAGQPVAELVPHLAHVSCFGGMRDEIQYHDADVEEDPDIETMFVSVATVTGADVQGDDRQG